MDYIFQYKVNESNFISNSLINIFSIPQMENVEWTPMSTITSENLLHLLIASPTNLTMQSVPFLGNRDFWDSLPLQENKNLFVVKDEL